MLLAPLKPYPLVCSEHEFGVSDPNGWRDDDGAGDFYVKIGKPNTHIEMVQILTLLSSNVTRYVTRYKINFLGGFE